MIRLWNDKEILGKRITHMKESYEFKLLSHFLKNYKYDTKEELYAILCLEFEKTKYKITFTNCYCECRIGSIFHDKPCNCRDECCYCEGGVTQITISFNEGYNNLINKLPLIIDPLYNMLLCDVPLNKDIFKHIRKFIEIKYEY